MCCVETALLSVMRWSRKRANYKALQMCGDGSREEYRLGLGGGGGFVQRSEGDEMRVRVCVCVCVCVVMKRVGVEQKTSRESKARKRRITEREGARIIDVGM